MYYKLGQSCVTNWGNLVLLQLGQTLLQIVHRYTTLLQSSFIITNWRKYCYKLGQLLQMATVITN